MIVREPAPIVAPLGVSDYEFYAAILNLKPSTTPGKGTPRQVAPSNEWAIPPAPPEWLWRCFFLAARSMVARRSEGQLALWDLRAAQFAWANLNTPEDWEPEGPVSNDAIKDLLLLMLDPGAVKEGLKKWPIVEIFDQAKWAFKHCKDLRRRLGAHGRYELMPRAAIVPVPRRALPTDSVAFYRLAFSQVFGTGKNPRLSFMGEDFSADMINDRVLEDCLPFWTHPAEAAHNLVAGLTCTTPEYVAQMISKQRRARPAARGYTY